ncbi:MAG: gliding motility-associated C-terminal domain-containing protein, partial [Saprospiraceae bacterium]|nr:gliding motility-associated C-terminal domain-containing protein [Saprospiraceae bacterium]
FYSAANPTGIDTLQAASGCDSILTISVTELAPPAQEMIALELCPGETFELNGSIYDENNPSGTETLIGQLSGCDSVLIEVALTFLELEAEWSQIDPTCLEETGYAVLEGVTGAPGPYSYALDGDPFTLVDTFPVIVGPLVPGSYQVLAENADGCLATELITLEPAPALTLDLGEDQIVGLGEVVTLNPVADFQIANLLWSPASALPCDTCLSLTFAPVNSLLVTATATDAFGCEASDELFIEVNTSIDIFIPNVFSPDFDGANDYFTIFAQEGLIQQIDLLQVYSRWGEKVFENTDFPANSLLDGWDGTFRGERLDPGVYVFYAEVTLLGGEARTLEGSVTLVR